MAPCANHRYSRSKEMSEILEEGLWSNYCDQMTNTGWISKSLIQNEGRDISSSDFHNYVQ